MNNWNGHHYRILITEEPILAPVSLLSPSKRHVSLGTDDNTSESVSTTSWTSVCLGLDHSASSFPSVSSSQGHSDDSWPRAVLLEGLISVNTYQQVWIIRICVLRIDCCFELATMVQKLMTFLYQNNRSFLFPLFAET